MPSIGFSELDILLMLGLADRCRTCNGTGTRIILVGSSSPGQKSKRTWVEQEKLVVCPICAGKGGWIDD